MKYYIGKSEILDVERCVNEVCSHFTNPKLILYYSQSEHFKEYTTLLHKKFPDAVCMGVTTNANISKTGSTRKGLMAAGFEEGISCCADVLEHVDKYPIKYVKRVQNCVKEIGKLNDTVCLAYTTAFCCGEESVLSTLNSVLLEKKIPIFGCTAGDYYDSQTTLVALNGNVYQNSCVFALFHYENGRIHFYRENIYKPISGHILTATKVDHVNRTVKEYNHTPAAKVYADELGVKESEIGSYFDSNPMGRIFGKDLFITANNASTSDKGITYHSRVYNNAKLVVLEADNYREVIEETMKKVKREVPNPTFAIMCHCLARTMLFEQDGYMQDFAMQAGNVLGDYIGVSGYGEQMNRQHFNQTMTLAVFEEKKRGVQ